MQEQRTTMCGTNRRWREDGAAAFVRERSRQCPPGRVRSRQFTKVQLRGSEDLQSPIRPGDVPDWRWQPLPSSLWLRGRRTPTRSITSWRIRPSPSRSGPTSTTATATAVHGVVRSADHLTDNQEFIHLGDRSGRARAIGSGSDSQDIRHSRYRQTPTDTPRLDRAAAGRRPLRRNRRPLRGLKAEAGVSAHPRFG